MISIPLKRELSPLDTLKRKKGFDKRERISALSLYPHMPVRELIDRSASFFGREPDLVHLRQRSQIQGLTAVVARAQMGKSTLLMELARQLSYDPAPNLLGPQPRLIGFTESAGETSDVMLRGVTDLYARWLSISDYRQQAKVAYEKQKDDLIGKAGEAVGSIFKELSKTVGLEAIGGLVNEAFKGLATVNRDLKNGGGDVPRLQIEQAHELVTLLHKITGRHTILVFDQWEKSLNTQLESNVLDSFLRHRNDWPPCHIFLGLRPEGVSYEAVQEFQSAYPTIAEVFDLPAMHLEGASASPLLHFIRERLAIANHIPDDELLNIIAGYPETVNRWTDPSNTAPKTSLADLSRIADDANTYRFREFKKLLPSLSDDARLLAMRLSLLSSTKDPETWRALKPLLLEDTKPKNLDTLKSTSVLIASAPPSYGHIKRTEAARRWFIENCNGELSQVCELFIYNLAARVRGLNSQAIPYAESLVDIIPLASTLELAKVPQALCQSARTLFGLPLEDQDQLVGITAASETAPQSIIPLLAMGLFNTLNHAKKVRDLPRRDTLLIDLRTLTHDHLENTAVRERLAKGLFNTLNDAKEEENLSRRDTLLTDLRALARDHPTDAVVREWLAKGLFNTLVYAKQEKDLVRRDALLVDLRALSHQYPEDVVVREHLAMGLFNTLDHSKGEGNLPRRDALLDDLRALAQDHPEEAIVREHLSMGLFNTLVDAKEEKDLPRRDALLDDLRALAQDHPEEAGVRERLAKGLFNTLNQAKEEQNLPRRDVLLEDLRTLAQNHPEDAVVREWLGKGLFNTLNHAKDEQNLPRRDSLLADLCTLALDHSQDPIAREWLAKALFIALNHAKQEQDLPRRDALLSDLRILAHHYPQDAAVREHLAKALFNTLIDSKEEEDLSRRDALLADLRTLAQDHPQDSTVREQFAKGLLVTLNHAKEEENLSRHDALLADLRQLINSHPEEPASIKIAPLLDSL